MAAQPLNFYYNKTSPSYKRTDVVINNDPGSLIIETYASTPIYNFNNVIIGFRTCKLTTQQVDLIATPNHRMLIKRRFGKERQYKEKFEFLTAEECFGKRLKYKKNANDYICDKYIEEIKIKDRIFNLEDWLLFFGIWYAEGCVTSGYVHLCAHKQRVKDKLNEILIKLDIQYKYTNCGTTKKPDIIIIRDKDIVNYLQPLSVGAIKKQLPEWVWSLRSEHCRILLEGLMLGDGYKNPSNTYLYYTSSVKLADDISRLALHGGWSANIRTRKDMEKDSTFVIRGKEYKRNADALEITINRTKNEPEVNHGHTKTQNAQSEEWIDFDDDVYCCSVPNETIYVRLNGKPVWTGNSRH
jgi:hypothetical protein